MRCRVKREIKRLHTGNNAVMWCCSLTYLLTGTFMTSVVHCALAGCTGNEHRRHAQMQASAVNFRFIYAVSALAFTPTNITWRWYHVIGIVTSRQAHGDARIVKLTRRRVVVANFTGVFYTHYSPDLCHFAVYFLYRPTPVWTLDDSLGMKSW